MRKQQNLLIVLAILIILVIIATVVVKSLNQPRSSTISVGDASFQQDPRADPSYQTDSGYQVTLLKSDPLRKYMSEVAINRLAANLKSGLYDKNQVIPSVATVTTQVSSNNQELTFSIKIDTDNKTYEIKAKDDGSIIAINVK